MTGKSVGAIAMKRDTAAAWGVICYVRHRLLAALP